MGIKDFLDRLKERREARKALLKQALEEDRIRRIVEERKKSANEREYERFLREEREEEIKKSLEEMRKVRDADIKFGHNPLNAKNITNHTDWEVLKERNMFTNDNRYSIMRTKNLFTQQRPKYRNRPKWLHRREYDG